MEKDWEGRKRWTSRKETLQVREREGGRGERKEGRDNEAISYS